MTLISFVGFRCEWRQVGCWYDATIVGRDSRGCEIAIAPAVDLDDLAGLISRLYVAGLYTVEMRDALLEAAYDESAVLVYVPEVQRGK